MNYVRNYSRKPVPCEVYMKPQREGDKLCHETNCILDNKGRIKHIELEGEKVLPHQFREKNIQYIRYLTETILHV